MLVTIKYSLTGFAGTRFCHQDIMVAVFLKVECQQALVLGALEECRQVPLS